MRSQITRIPILAFLAAIALSVAAAGAAQAEGPSWINKSGKLTAIKKTKSENKGAFKLSGATAIKCEKETDTGELVPTDPGLDRSKVTFSVCSAEGKPTCAATGIGISKGFWRRRDRS